MLEHLGEAAPRDARGGSALDSVGRRSSTSRVRAPTGRGIDSSSIGVVMKVQATVVMTFQARSLEDAGAVLDDLLERARERDDVDIGRVEVATPPGDRPVVLPPVAAPGPAAAAPSRTTSERRF